MDHSARLIPLNIDLSSECFELALDTFLQNWPLAGNGAAVFRGDNIFEHTGYNSAYLAIFFERSTELDMKGTSIADETLASLLEQLDQHEVKPVISDVALVDCGKESCCPLSSFSVLRQKLELISGFVPPHTSAEIFSVDFNGEVDMGIPVNFFATTSEEFRSHMGRYVERTLNNLNGEFGQDKLPEFRRIQDVDFRQALARIDWSHQALSQ